MKKYLILILAFLFLSVPFGTGFASASLENGDDQFDATLNKIVQGLKLDNLSDSLGQNELAQELFAHEDIGTILKNISKGISTYNAWDILKALFSRFMDAMRGNLLLVLQFLAIAVIMALLGAVGPTVLSGEVAELCQFIGYLLAVMLAGRTLANVFGIGIAAISKLTGVMQSIFPVMLTLLTALGSTASVGIFQPAMTILTGSILTLIKNISMPAILVGGVLTIVEHISSRIQIKNATALVIKCAQWMTAVVFVVFLGVTAMQGLAGATFDGVSIRTAKYAIDKFVPIVGGLVSDTVDTLVGCSLLVKQGVGIIGLILLAASILEPVIQMAAVAISFRVAAAIIEPFGEKRLPDCLDGMARVFTLLSIAVMAAGTMMFILLTLVIRAGNINIMLR